MGADTPRRIALLRGINVGGAHKLPMKELAALCEGLGCEGVRTCIQSGNVVFDGGPPDVDDALHEVIEGAFGYDIPVVVRTAAELDATINAMPFDVSTDARRSFHVGFLGAAPRPERIAALDPERSPPDRFEVLGREAYLHCPGGSARSKLTSAWLEKTLGVRCTMRNWNTVLRLQAMTR